METENKEDSLHTEEVQDIIGTPPRWLFRWGISLVLAVIFLCGLISSFIQYPEVIKTRVRLVTEPPQRIMAEESVTLVKLLVENGANVKKNQTLAITESRAGRHVIAAPAEGELTYAGIVREKQQLQQGQPVFNLTFPNQNIYGEMLIGRNEFAEIKPHQTVEVKVKKSQNEEDALLEGTIKYITDNGSKADEYIAELDFSPSGKNSRPGIKIRNGMIADAEIITARSSVFHRILQSLIKRLNTK